jgi:hypothetical protein
MMGAFDAKQMSFKDHFSAQATDYSKFRPGYPREIFTYLGSIAPSRRLAWDCGTGSGQAAVGLASVFDRVIATDASEKQIANAEPHERVEYRVASGEESDLESAPLISSWSRKRCIGLISTVFMPKWNDC